MTVYLVGAGPGDPGLLTVRGAELLRAAEVIVHDRLADASLLDLAPPAARRIDVGKEPGGPIEQETINALLIREGRAGRTRRPAEGRRPVRLRTGRRGDPGPPGCRRVVRGGAGHHVRHRGARLRRRARHPPGSVDLLHGGDRPQPSCRRSGNQLGSAGGGRGDHRRPHGGGPPGRHRGPAAGRRPGARDRRSRGSLGHPARAAVHPHPPRPARRHARSSRP